MVNSDEEVARIARNITRDAIAEGRVIEVGWRAFSLMTIPINASAVQRDEMRNAFFAGAQHLLGSIMSIMDAGAEPTAGDMAAMDKIAAELAEYTEGLKLRVNRPKGTS